MLSFLLVLWMFSLSGSLLGWLLLEDWVTVDWFRFASFCDRPILNSLMLVHSTQGEIYTNQRGFTTPMEISPLERVTCIGDVLSFGIPQLSLSHGVPARAERRGMVTLGVCGADLSVREESERDSDVGT
ncbi:hypothetical protein C8J56DRAFT_902479 [Mycena floridula]|nr:hypothetical protein C8J56DRAFT_902479 [Mycena floridula]